MVSIFWADKMVDDIIARVEADPTLQKLVEQGGYFVYDEKTPSGEIHIGSGRGWVIHEILAKILRERGKKAVFVLSSDDHDPFDKPIKGKPEYDQYLGMSFRDIPSPVEGYKSWGHYYFAKVTDKFKEYGMDVELASTGDDYEAGVFNDATKKILDKYTDVQNIFEEIYEKPYEKIPFNVRCENCKKVATTLATKWDGEFVHYECKDGVVKWANGCGHSGKISPYNGNGKFPWKVEWAMKWPSKGVIVETAGKDHFTKGGARTISIRISDRVLGYPPPWPSTATEEGPGYEFFNVGGKKMSTSKGMGSSFAELPEHVPAKILRYLMVRSKPSSVIDFDPSRKDDLLLIYDQYDMTERVYFGKEESERAQELKRIYEFSQIGPILKEFPPQITLRHAAVAAQIASKNDDAIALLQKGDVPAELSKEHVAYLNERLDAARMWLREFAPENEKFSVQETVSSEIKEQLTEKQQAAAADVKTFLEAGDHDEQTLFEEFYKICEKHEIKNSEFFKGMYLILLAKTRGPKLAGLIVAIGKEKVLALLEQA
ncbi:MAG: lysine--tRNA ligase [Candidatus Woesearchaeota archaeon]|nr:lysine--tRNA ligase [Candidatus Woesearchaeota archaeon]